MLSTEFKTKLFEEYQKIFDIISIGKYIIRWNEFACPGPDKFTILDREALKLIFAIFLSQENKKIDIRKIIQISFASFIRKLILTDIKNSVYEQLKKYSGFEINRYIVNCVEQNYKFLIDDEIFNYIKNYDNLHTKEKILIDVASNIVTSYELKLLKPLNNNNFEFKKIENSFKKSQNKLKKFKEYKYYLRKYNQYKKIFDVINNLRFQKRGIRLSLINNFSILEHLYITSFIGYNFAKYSSKDLDKSILFALILLFHDIPEALTRDIISPVKKANIEIDKAVENIEKKLIKKYFIKNIKNKKFQKNIYRLIFIKNFSVKEEITKPEAKINFGKKIYFEKDKNNKFDLELIKFIDEIFALLEAEKFSIDNYSKIDKNNDSNSEIIELIKRIKEKYNLN